MWLVKSGGNVLGPFSLDELIEKIQSKEVVLHDEVLMPLAKWHYVREEPQLAEVVEHIRSKAVGEREDTITTTGTEDMQVVDAEFEDLEHTPARSNDKGSNVKTFGALGDERLQQQLAQTSWRVWPLTILFLFALVSVLWWNHKETQKSVQEPLSQESLINSAHRFSEVGDYGHAIEYYSRALALVPSDVEINLALAPLLISIEAQTVEARRMLQKVAGNELSNGDRVRLQTALGLADLIDGDLDGALTSTLEAQKLDPQFTPALINLGTLYFLKGQLSEARSFLQKAQKNLSYSSLVQLLIHRGDLERIGKGEHSALNLKEAAKTLQNLGQELYDGKQEAYFLAAYAYALANDSEQTLMAAEMVLDVDPQMTEHHWHDPLISRRLLAWSDMSQFCSQIVGKAPNSPRMKAFSGFCRAKSGQRAEAKKEFELGVSQASEDSLLRATFAAFLMDNSQEDEARAALRVNEDREQFELPLIVSARLCAQSKDAECAKQMWDKLLKLNPRSVVAIAGKAQELSKTADQSHLKDLVAQGLVLSPKYIPLLKLQSDYLRK